MKKVWSVLLAMLFLLGSLPVGIVSAAIASGTTGDCVWTLDERGHLTISGDGAMEDYYDYGIAPWGTAITAVTLRHGVTHIGDLAFSGCTSLASISIADSVTSIGWLALNDCTALTSLTIPDLVTHISDGALAGCTALTTLEVGCGIRVFSWNRVLDGCTALQTIRMAEENPYYSVQDNILYNKDGSQLLYCPRSRNTAVTVADGTVTMAESAFADCNWLPAVTLPNSVIEVGYTAFANCSMLAAVEIPDSLQTIEWGGFLNCDSLRSIHLGPELTLIKNSAFRNCYALSDVYYAGTPEDREAKLEIHGNNYRLTGANWHYEGCSHEYDHPYDANCNLCGTVRAVETPSYGDINGDAKVNIRDMGLLQQTLNGWEIPLLEWVCDVNVDGKVNVRDLGIMQQYLNGWDVHLGPEIVDGDVLEAVPDHLSGTQIKMMTWWTPGGDDKAKVAAFEEATGIQVAYTTTPMGRYQTNLSAMVAAQNSPAIAAIINEWYPQMITRGLMQPLSNVKGWDFTDDSIYATSLMDQFSYKGEHYGMAVKGSASTTFHTMFFNKGMLEKCGVTETPYDLWKAGNWNWDTFLQIARKCTDPRIGRTGVSTIGQYVWMLSAGTDFVKNTPEGLVNNIRTSEVLNAWYWNWDLINTYKVVDTSFTGATPFYQGKAAMLGAGSYMMQYNGGFANYVPQYMKDDWSVVPFPSPKGMNVAACDGTVWGFPKGVSGNKLQSAAWYLRYYLDDYNNPIMRESFYPADHPECWEVMNWMWDQTIQSYNSVGVLTYGGEHDAYSIQYSLVDEADTKAKLKSNLDTWYSVLDANIQKIERELG